MTINLNILAALRKQFCRALIAAIGVEVDELLGQNRQIGHIWETGDVQKVRPDLDDQQSWEVLKDVRRGLDSEFGITWMHIEYSADRLYPEPGDDYGFSPESEEADA